ncbi:hypothetical protein [Endozoicomonas sp. Mp262]|uniref:hypothetical protein n=1 Tax=Endozoicomonas sp. Mp262 TaxID=2919499 RepID=UPI0021DA9507
MKSYYTGTTEVLPGVSKAVSKLFKKANKKGKVSRESFNHFKRKLRERLNLRGGSLHIRQRSIHDSYNLLKINHEISQQSIVFLPNNTVPIYQRGFTLRRGVMEPVIDLLSRFTLSEDRRWLRKNELVDCQLRDLILTIGNSHSNYVHKVNVGRAEGYCPPTGFNWITGTTPKCEVTARAPIVIMMSNGYSVFVLVIDSMVGTEAKCI